MQQMFKPTVGLQTEWVVCFLVKPKTVFRESGQVVAVPRNNCKYFLPNTKACNPAQNRSHRD